MAQVVADVGQGVVGPGGLEPWGRVGAGTEGVGSRRRWGGQQGLPAVGRTQLAVDGGLGSLGKV